MCCLRSFIKCRDWLSSDCAELKGKFDELVRHRNQNSVSEQAQCAHNIIGESIHSFRLITVSVFLCLSVIRM